MSTTSENYIQLKSYIRDDWRLKGTQIGNNKCATE